MAKAIFLDTSDMEASLRKISEARKKQVGVSSKAGWCGEGEGRTINPICGCNQYQCYQRERRLSRGYEHRLCLRAWLRWWCSPLCRTSRTSLSRSRREACLNCAVVSLSRTLFMGRYWTQKEVKELKSGGRRHKSSWSCTLDIFRLHELRQRCWVEWRQRRWERRRSGQRDQWRHRWHCCWQGASEMWLRRCSSGGVPQVFYL